MSIGIDIVDLAAVPAMDAQRTRRYCEKVCSAEEAEFILAAEDSQKVLWQFWALKEAIYKCTFDPHQPKAFCAREINIPIAFFSAKGGFECYFENAPLYLDLLQQDNAIIASASIRREVEFYRVPYQNRDLLYKTITKKAATKLGLPRVALQHNEQGQPGLWVPDLEEHIPISMAHHGRFAVWGI
ncbi:MAG: 4'-phosphopantetheinyl transferase superfamily protein [Chitinophagaceae bacterium]